MVNRNLLQLGNFTLHSGAAAKWKLECDALTQEDWKALAYLVTQITPPFSHVVGVPRGGLPLAVALIPYLQTGANRILLVDDVLTTGGSLTQMKARVLEEMRRNQYALSEEILTGVVVFARGKCPAWVSALFTIPEKLWLSDK